MLRPQNTYLQRGKSAGGLLWIVLKNSITSRRLISRNNRTSGGGKSLKALSFSTPAKYSSLLSSHSPLLAELDKRNFFFLRHREGSCCFFFPRVCTYIYTHIKKLASALLKRIVLAQHIYVHTRIYISHPSPR